MNFRVQLVHRLNRDGNSWTYEPLGAIVTRDSEFIPVAFINADGDDWAEQIRQDFERWPESPLSFMSAKFDQNGTRTAYAEPVDVKADTAQDAAEKVRIRDG